MYFCVSFVIVVLLVLVLVLRYLYLYLHYEYLYSYSYLLFVYLHLYLHYEYLLVFVFALCVLVLATTVLEPCSLIFSDESLCRLRKLGKVTRAEHENLLTYIPPGSVVHAGCDDDACATV